MKIIEDHVDINTDSGQMRLHRFRPSDIPPTNHLPGVIVFTEIYQVTGPVERLCRMIASEGYLVVSPESYHEFEPLGTVLEYSVEGTDKGNAYKIKKKLQHYDSDNVAIIKYLQTQDGWCNGVLGCVGMCLGGHLSLRCGLLPQIRASVCLFPTDVHSRSLGEGKSDDTLMRCGEIKGECVMIFGKQDSHVPREGRDMIRKKMEDEGVLCTWIEFNAQHAFVRDELSKGRYDGSLARISYDVMFEVFKRRLLLAIPE